MYLEAFLGLDNTALQSVGLRGPENNYLIKAPSVWQSPYYAGPYNQTGFSALPSWGIYEFGAEEAGFGRFLTSTTTSFSDTMLFTRSLGGSLQYNREVISINQGATIRCLKD
jgi:hypothetical protein